MEFDVCLAGKIKDTLHMLQYPLRPNYRPYGDQGELTKVEVGLVTSVSSTLNNMSNSIATAQNRNVKVEEDNFKMHYRLNRQSQNYDNNATDHKVRTLV